MNLDGSSFGNLGPTEGGGVLWNHEGRFVFAISKFFGSYTNNEVELRAIVEGIKICRQLGYCFIDIECDSLIMLSWLMNRVCTMWYLWDLPTLLDGFDFSIKHIFREGNKVADELARVGASGEELMFLEPVLL